MAKAPTTKTARTASVTSSSPETAPPWNTTPASDTASTTDSAPAPLVAILMLVPQEGPTVSRLRGDVLTIGTHIDADEAQRLIDADFAEPA
ncbi:hypothetical protein [Sphingomonas paucimobilis]|uniref:hypothetical protein n=1 Tax=Sphingomonas paucimobilis TaxID=13689 RepID=UPI0030F5D49A